jgi:hypothetical protein
MYTKYNHCGVPTRIGNQCYIPKQHISSSTSGGPESMRMLSQVCPFAYVTTTVPAGCTVVNTSTSTTAATEKIRVPVYPGNTAPVVPVQTQPASLTTQQRALAVAAVESDPYNPATRFAAYFPAPPIPYICPERIPNNEPLPSSRPCVGFTRFTTSVELSTITGVGIEYQQAVSTAKGNNTPLPPLPDVLKTTGRC